MAGFAVCILIGLEYFLHRIGRVRVVRKGGSGEGGGREGEDEWVGVGGRLGIRESVRGFKGS